MKKLIIAGIAMVLGIVANAASAEWSAEGIYGYETGAYAPSTYLIYAFDTSALTRDAAISQFSAQDFSNISLGFVADDYDSGEAVGAITGYANGAPVNAYLVVFNSDSADTATYAYVSDVVSGAIGAAGQSPSLGFDLSSSATASNWTSLGSPVPEPTSGLLMLLGMAGLALRRRRA